MWPNFNYAVRALSAWQQKLLSCAWQPCVIDLFLYPFIYFFICMFNFFFYCTHIRAHPHPQWHLLGQGAAQVPLNLSCRGTFTYPVVKRVKRHYKLIKIILPYFLLNPTKWNPWHLKILTAKMEAWIIFCSLCVFFFWSKAHAQHLFKLYWF